MKRALRRHIENKLTIKRLKVYLSKLDYFFENNKRIYKPKLCNISVNSANKLKKKYKHQRTYCSCYLCKPDKYKREKFSSNELNSIIQLDYEIERCLDDYFYD